MAIRTRHRIAALRQAHAADKAARDEAVRVVERRNAALFG
jgi:hypothetical protein